MNDKRNHGLVRWFCRKFCHDVEQQENEHRVPPELRKASHDLANATSSLQGAARDVIRKGDAFQAIAKAMRRQP